MPQQFSIRPVAFPRGVADSDSGATHACVRDRSGRIVAIALAGGSVLWRSAQALRPLVIARGEVIALRTAAPPVCVALALTDANAGREVWTSDPLPLPAWAELESQDPARFWIAIAIGGASLVLRWRARARYAGGAAPSRRVLERAARDDEGSAAIERATGKVTMLSTAIGPEPAVEPEAGPAAPQILEQQQLGGRLYQIALEAVDRNVRTVLRALDLRGGAPLWETIIDEGPARPPRALRL